MGQSAPFKSGEGKVKESIMACDSAKLVEKVRLSKQLAQLCAASILNKRSWTGKNENRVNHPEAI